METSANPHALLVDIKGLATMLRRSERSLLRDGHAGRLPAAVNLGGSKRWRVSEIEAWVEAGCPARKFWDARRRPTAQTKSG